MTKVIILWKRSEKRSRSSIICRRSEADMGKVIAVCISEKRGFQKTNIHTARLVEDWGIEGDAHAGKGHRQVSL